MIVSVVPSLLPSPSSSFPSSFLGSSSTDLAFLSCCCCCSLPYLPRQTDRIPYKGRDRHERHRTIAQLAATAPAAASICRSCWQQQQQAAAADQLQTACHVS